MTARQINMYALVAIMWGSSFALLVPVIASLGWVGGVAFRGFIASAIVFVIALALKRNLQFAGNWKHFAVLGATSVGMNLGGMNYALDRLGTQLTAILVTTIPLYSLLIESIWSKTKPTLLKTVGLLIGFSGVVILVGLSPQSVNREFWLGVFGSFIASFGFALGGNYSRVKAAHIGSWEQTIGTFLFGGLWTLPLLIWVPIVRTPTVGDILSLIAVAATASSFAYILYFKLVAEVGATTALTTEFLVPVVAVILGYFLFSETLSVNQIIGTVIIMVGCALVMGLNPFAKQKNLTESH
jgi:drug/metabolite transporter (DMT)-like permease